MTVTWGQLCARCARPSYLNVCRPCRRALKSRSLRPVTHGDARSRRLPVGGAGGRSATASGDLWPVSSPVACTAGDDPAMSSGGRGRTSLLLHVTPRLPVSSGLSMSPSGDSSGASQRRQAGPH